MGLNWRVSLVKAYWLLVNGQNGSMEIWGYHRTTPCLRLSPSNDIKRRSDTPIFIYYMSYLTGYDWFLKKGALLAMIIIIIVLILAILFISTKTRFNKFIIVLIGSWVGIITLEKKCWLGAFNKEIDTFVALKFELDATFMRWDIYLRFDNF